MVNDGAGPRSGISSAEVDVSGVHSVPPSLLDGDLRGFWAELASRLERNGDAWRGRIAVSSLSSHARGVLLALVGTPGRRTVEARALEAALVDLGVGKDLPDALAALGAPVSSLPQQRRTDRQRRADGRAAAREALAAWPEPWASTWLDEIIGAGVLAGFGREESSTLVDAVRRVLDAIERADSGASISRIDLAAEVLGSSHALDPGTRLERATTRALGHLVAAASGNRVEAERSADAGSGSALPAADPWSQLGVHRSLVSGAALTWRLPLTADGPLATVVRACDELRLPFVVTRLAIDTAGCSFAPDAEVLIVENPRVVELAAQRGAATPMICANGNPSTTVNLLIDGLLAAGARLRYHGDFDVAGLAMCARMQIRGVEPWRMSAADYLAALDEADQHGVALPVDHAACEPTPWDPTLKSLFDEHRRIVHEERLLQQIVR